MYELTGRDISRTAITHRWHMVQTSRQQSLSDHLYLVTMFSLILINKAFGEHRPKSIDRELVMERALTHDLPEVVVGDMPTPVKKRIRAMGGGAILDNIENGVDSRISYLKRKAVGCIEGDIVKLADMIEAISFLDGCGRGNHAKMVKILLTKDLYEKVTQMEIDWPMANWRSAARLMLQDLSSGVDTMLRYEAESNKITNKITNKNGNATKYREATYLESSSMAESEGGEI